MIKKFFQKEDEAFEQNEQIRNNLRRGFSILEFYINNKYNIQENDNSDQINQIINFQEKKITEKIIISRKGLPKFFDLQRVSLGKDFDNNLGNRLSQLILKPIYESLEKGENIHIYKLGKANGENSQISYIMELDKWVIASKNVSLIANNLKDLDDIIFKNSPKFGFALLIAQTWFNIIEKMDQDKLQQLKVFMNQKTFVGEYCGNPNYQHLVKYSSIDLHFFGIVENYGQDACLPPDYSYQIFNKFGLTTVKIEKISTNSQDFIPKITQIFDLVEQGSLEVEGEGAVCYFVSENQQAQQKTLILCKLKSLEYRILRKLREKLKTTLIKPKNYNKNFNKFKTEVEQLCLHNQPFKPLQQYFDLAQYIFNFVSSKLKQEDKRIISERYISFLEIAIKAYYEKKEIDINEIKQQLNETSLNPEEIEEFQEFQKQQQPKQLTIIIISPPYYQTQEFQSIENEFQIEIQKYFNPKQQQTQQLSIVNTFKPPQLHKDRGFFIISCGWKESDKQQIFEKILEDRDSFNKNQKKHFAKEFFQDFKSEQTDLDQMYQKLEQIYSVYKEKQVKLISDMGDSYFFQDKFLDLDSINQSFKLNDIIKNKFRNFLPQKQLVIFIPLTIPGTGKTYILQNIQQYFQTNDNEITFRILSYDTITQQLIFFKQMVAQSYYKIYQSVQQQANQEYNKQLIDLISNQLDLKQKNIIFLDKNILPDELSNIIQLIQNQIKVDYKIIAILPKCEERCKIIQGEFPFSIKYLFSCISRVFNRDDHETLNGDCEMRLLVCLQHFKAFKQFKLTPLSMEEKAIDNCIEIEFHNEKNMSKLQPILEKLLLQLLESKNDLQLNNPLVKEFIEKFYSEQKIDSFIYEELDQNNQVSDIITQFKSIFDLFQQQNQSIEEEQKVEDKKTLLLVVHLTIPSTGKTTFIEQFIQYNQDQKYTFRLISSDQIRQQLMNTHLLKQPKDTKQQAFDKTKKKSTVIFYDRLEILINQTSQMNSQQNIIFIDKNHPPNALKRFLDFVDQIKQKNKNLNIKLVAIQPQCETYYQIQNDYYPFSLTYLFTCICRIIRRKKHETLEGNPQHLVKVLFMFFKQFKNFDQKILEKFDHQIQVAYHYEDDLSEQIIPVQLKNLADLILLDNQTDINDQKVEDFVSELYNQKSIDFDEYPFTNKIFENFDSDIMKCFVIQK